jgi:hypothetical protein
MHVCECACVCMCVYACVCVCDSVAQDTQVEIGDIVLRP